jgi:hypothetical protein
VLRWEGASTTGSELLAAIYRYARALESLGIARGDLVAMYAPNRPEALALRYATHLLGAASVYLSAPPDPGKRAQMLVDFRPRLVVVFPETAHLLPPTTAPCGAIGPSRRSRSTSTNWRAGRTRPRWRVVPYRATSPWWCPPGVRPACRRAACATSRPRRGLRRDRRTAGYPGRPAGSAMPPTRRPVRGNRARPRHRYPDRRHRSLAWPDRRHCRVPGHDHRGVRPVGGINSGGPARGLDPAHRAGQAEPPGDPPARPRACHRDRQVTRTVDTEFWRHG